jgi:hypothetical protein
MRFYLLLCAFALPAIAQTDFRDMTLAERAAFGAEFRKLLRDEPKIVDAALAKPNHAAQVYQQEADTDRT